MAYVTISDLLTILLLNHDLPTSRSWVDELSLSFEDNIVIRKGN